MAAPQCVQIKEGPFAELADGEDDGGPTFTVVSPGVVRVAFKTTDMQSEVTEGAQDEETKAMMAAFFEGHFITMQGRRQEGHRHQHDARRRRHQRRDQDRRSST